MSNSTTNSHVSAVVVSHSGVNVTRLQAVDSRQKMDRENIIDGEFTFTKNNSSSSHSNVRPTSKNAKNTLHKGSSGSFLYPLFALLELVL